MSFRPRLGFPVLALDIDLELLSIDPPDTSAPDLEGGKLPRANQRVDLRHAHVQVERDIVESHKAPGRLVLRACEVVFARRHGPDDIIREGAPPLFAFVCSLLQLRSYPEPERADGR